MKAALKTVYLSFNHKSEAVQKEVITTEDTELHGGFNAGSFAAKTKALFLPPCPPW